MPVLAACLLVAIGAGVAGAQEPDPVEDLVVRDTQWPASPLLPAGHWALVAVRRGEALGLVAGYQPAQRTAPRLVVGAALREASQRAAQEAPHLEELARGWYDAFREEFPEVEPLLVGEVVGSGPRGSAVRLDYLDHAGREAPGIGVLPPDRSGGVPLPDRSGMSLGAELAAAVGPHLSLLVEPEVGPERSWLRGVDLVAGWGPLTFSLGRQPVGYGYAAGGAVVLSGAAAFDRLQLETARPFELPGWLSYLGPVSFNTFLSRFTEERHVGDPYFWGASGSIRPHPRFTFSIHRAAFFGGGTAPEPITPYNLLLSFVGKHVGQFANQIVAAEVRYRVPTEALLPVTLYLEWGAEDSAGAFYKVPGNVFGIFLPALPALPQVAMGVERSYFGTACCGNPLWYRHVGHLGGWAARDVPLGHHLGGNGSEWLLYTRADLLGARLRLDGRAFWRSRLGDNQFAPGREGDSFGLAGNAAWRLASRADLHLSLFREAGATWSEQALQAGVRVFF